MRFDQSNATKQNSWVCDKIGRIMIKSEFSKNTVTLMGSAIIAHAIYFIAMPVLARVYNPSFFGTFALYVSITTIVSAVAMGRYEFAIMLPDDDDSAINMLTICIIVVFLVSISIFAVLLVFGRQISDLLRDNELLKWLYLMPVTILLTGLYQSFYYWLNRKKDYKKLAVSKLLQSMVTVVVNIGLGYFVYGIAGLIFGNIIGYAAVALFLGWKVYRKEMSKQNVVSLAKIKSLSMQYINYPLKSSIGAFTNAASYQVEYILFSINYDLFSTGCYYFAHKMVSVPKIMLSGAIWQVFAGGHSRKTTEEIFSAVDFYQNKMLRLTTLLFFSSLFIAPNIFLYMFGDKWSSAAIYLYPMIVAAHINLIVASYSLFLIIDRPDAEMIYNLALLILKVLAIVLTCRFLNNVLYSVIAISIVQGVMFLLLGSWNYKQLGKTYLYFPRLYCKNIAMILPYMAALFLITSLTKNFVILLLCFIIINLLHLRNAREVFSKSA